MECQHCGANLNPTARFCRTCGKPVPEGSGPSAEYWATPTTLMDRPEIRAPRWRLSKIEGTDIPEGFPLKALNRVGRDPKCDIHLPSSTVSRVHAQIEWDGAKFLLTDLNSTNGTYINRHLVQAPTPLRIGQTIFIGNYRFLVMRDTAVCSNCRSTVRLDDVYCQYCGQTLVGKESTSQQAEAGGRPPGTLPETAPIKAETPSVPMPRPDLTPPPRFQTPPPAAPKATAPQPPAQTTPPQPQTPAASPAPPAPAARPAAPRVQPPAHKASVRQSTVPAPVVRSTPPPLHPHARTGGQEQPSKPAKKRSRWRSCLLLLVISLCGLIGLAGAGYYLYTTGVIDKRTFLNIGAGEINIINTTEAQLSASLTRLDTEDGEPAVVNSVDLDSYEIGGLAYIDAGRYRLDIVGTPVEGTCTMVIGGGDLFRVVAVPEGIAIIEEGGNQTTTEELNMATSALCRR